MTSNSGETGEAAASGSDTQPSSASVPLHRIPATSGQSLLAAPEIVTPLDQSSNSPTSSPSSLEAGRERSSSSQGITELRRKSSGHSPRLSPSGGSGSSALSTSPSSSSSSSGHRHARSRSVNLSPVLHSSPGMGGLRWDPPSHLEESNQPSGLSTLHGHAHYHQIHHPHMQPGLAAQAPGASKGYIQEGAVPSSSSSTHLRPTSPVYINVSGYDTYPAGVSGSPRSAGSSSSTGSDLSSSPETRKSSHLSRSMEKANSTGSLGVDVNGPHSPHSSLRRAASPVRPYPIPVSPRLQAFGASSPGKSLSHHRKLSGGTLDPIARTPSPLLAGPSHLRRSPSPSIGKTIIADPELPVDSVWPSAHQESHLPTTVNGSEAIPVSAQATLTTPVPPSLREEMHGRDSLHGVTSIPIPGTSSSPKTSHRGSPSPLHDYHFSSSPNARRRRTPSPSSFGRQPDPHYRAASPRTFDSHASSGYPPLTAPQPIPRNVFELANQAVQRHRRSLSETSSGSSDGQDAHEVRGTSPPRAHIRSATSPQVSPTHRAISRPQGSLARVDAQHALAHVPSTGEGRREAGAERPAPTQTPGADTRDNDAAEPLAIHDPSLSQSHDLGSDGFQPSERGIAFDRKSPGLTTGAATGGLPFRPQSPAMRGSTPPITFSASGESPPKTRSFIGMPPRSGYDLSDDPDDVGSEDGSVSSGKDSIDTDEETEQDDEDENFHREEAADDEGNDGDGPGQGNARPEMPPKRPSLTAGSIVAPMPVPMKRNWSNEDASRETGLDVDEGQAGDGVNGPEHDNYDPEAVEDANDAEQGAESMTEDTLSTLERIFLFAKSEMTYHRILVSHSLADWIMDVELSEAVEFVVPLLNGLACDTNEVCMAFAPQLHRVMWHFFRNCPLVEEREQSSEHEPEQQNSAEIDDNATETASRPRISVKTFSPLLCAMLLNSNAGIANATQMAIVFFCARLQGVTLLGDAFDADDCEVTAQQPTPTSGVKIQDRRTFDHDTALIRDAAARGDRRVKLDEYAFGDESRERVRDEILRSVGLAIGHLHSDRHNQEGQDVPAVQNTEGEPTPEQQGALASSSAMEDSNGQEPQNNDSLEVQNHAALELEERPSLNAHEDSSHKSDEVNGHSETKEVDSEELSMVEDASAEAESQEWQVAGMGDTSMASGASADGDSISMSFEEEVAVGRMASLSLLAALGSEDLVSRDFLLQEIVPEMILLAGDQTFFVRKEAAVSFGMLARGIGPEEIKRLDIVSIFERLCQDDIWHVRQAACLSLPNLFAQIDDQHERREKLVVQLRHFVADTSRNVRVAALDIIGEAIYLFHKDSLGIPDELVRHFLGKDFDQDQELDEQQKEDDGKSSSSRQASSAQADDEMNEEKSGKEYDQDFPESQDVHFSEESSHSEELSQWAGGEGAGWSTESQPYAFSYPQSYDSDADRPLVMAYNLPAVALTLGGEKWHIIRDVHSQLCNHPASKVRRSLAASLHELAKIVGEKASTADLLPLAERFIDPHSEHDGEVKMAILENIHVLLTNVSFARGLETIKLLHDQWSAPDAGAPFLMNWRLREKLIAKVPLLADRFLLEDDNGFLVLLVQAAIVDGVSAVRKQAVKAVGRIFELFEKHDQVLADGFLGMLIDVAENQESYRARVATLQCIQELCRGTLQRASVEVLVLPRLQELSKDEIVDVRIALANLVTVLLESDHLYALPQSHSEPLMKVVRRLVHDESQIVRSIMTSLGAVKEMRSVPPPSPLPERTRRELTLGPSSGGPHRPAKVERSYDTMLDQESLAMEEGNHQEDGFNQDLGFGQGQTPSLTNSALARRRRQHVNGGQPNGTDGDWSMFEDVDEETTSEEDRDHYRRLSGGSSDEDGDEQMIVLPADDQMLMSAARNGHSDHAFSSPLSSAIGDIEDDDDDGTPHHLLSVASGSPLQTNHKSEAHSTDTLRAFPPNAFKQASPVLESPSRGVFASKSASNSNSPSAMGEPAPVQDPFLAFVADKHTDWDKVGDKSPTRGQRGDTWSP